MNEARKELWIVGKTRAVAGPFTYYDFVGVYDDKFAALERCVEPGMFIAPVKLNESLPCDPLLWEGVEWPDGELVPRA
jgi:hypothetical protein